MNIQRIRDEIERIDAASRVIADGRTPAMFRLRLAKCLLDELLDLVARLLR